MAQLATLCLAASLSFAVAQPAGSVLYDVETHKPSGSTGCGKASPYKQGKTSVATATYGGVKRTFRIYVPQKYNKNTPMPIIFQHPGWGMAAVYEEQGAGITLYAESLGFISVTPQGMDDNNNRGGPWFSWNAVGTSQSPGPGGPTCTEAGNYPSYCYNSCQKCTDKPQCDWTTCDEDVTPTGTGRINVGGFIPGLYDTLEEQLCIDTTREFAAGESNGGMMTYQLGVDLASRLAAIAPQFGSFHRGFNMVPLVGVPVLDIHGRSDTTVPANVSLSGDGYYYTPTHEIFNGNKYSKGWKEANGCSGEPRVYHTDYAGIKDLWCVDEGGDCTGGAVVRCDYIGGHNWFNGGGKDNGGLVVHFLMKWVKPSHIGRGYSIGENLGPGHLLENVTVLDLKLGEEDPSSSASLVQWSTGVLEPAAKGHYGNPTQGCLSDEDAIPVGTGRICAPRIGTKPKAPATPPAPKCKLGGVVANPENGCPSDANIVNSQAWPICLAKGDNVTDPYSAGSFHCLLVCPCNVGAASSGECGIHSHDHCPAGARCERGELRKRDQGVCTYAFPSSATSIVV